MQYVSDTCWPAACSNCCFSCWLRKMSSQAHLTPVGPRGRPNSKCIRPVAAMAASHCCLGTVGEKSHNTGYAGIVESVGHAVRQAAPQEAA